ncbi:uncharacterized protein LOC125240353 isoform X2 [Leguminivora glycinivorella]|uniref:uncharacterized protein LOC125240353 isoform X2 n=1 Tax=Leguminivora glycinivorella TaxID=1035111 RepID=UPI00200F2B10|nr:uncharacterized protein LOC125240353 isoform X2 [Leguminivora glycinivorella]
MFNLKLCFLQVLILFRCDVICEKVSNFELHQDYFLAGTLVFTCKAFVNPGDVLSWYQIKETPRVTVTPNINPYIFKVDGNITTFICNGTKPVDGRKLNWYIQEPNSKPKYLETQLWDNSSFINILPLKLDETYHRKKLFCAQDFEFKYTYPNGSFYIEGYNELVRSNMIELLDRGIPDRGTVDEGSEMVNEESKDDGNVENNVAGLKVNQSSMSPLVYAIPAVVAAMLLAATVWLVCRRRHRATTSPKNDHECIYATTTLNYVTLDLKRPTCEYTSSQAQEKSPYAQIVGVYRPNLNQQ